MRLERSDRTTKERDEIDESEIAREKERAERKEYYKNLLNDWNSHPMTEIIQKIFSERLNDANLALLSLNISHPYYEKMMVSIVQSIKNYKFFLELNAEEITDWFEPEIDNDFLKENKEG